MFEYTLTLSEGSRIKTYWIRGTEDVAAIRTVESNVEALAEKFCHKQRPYESVRQVDWRLNQDIHTFEKSSVIGPNKAKQLKQGEVTVRIDRTVPPDIAEKANVEMDEDIHAFVEGSFVIRERHRNENRSKL